jgi:hypothetical protein
MPPSSQPGVFISYAHRDGAELARQLHSDLAKKFDTWLDTHRLTAGDIWSREIEDTIEQRVPFGPPMIPNIAELRLLG